MQMFWNTWEIEVDVNFGIFVPISEIYCFSGPTPVIENDLSENLIKSNVGCLFLELWIIKYWILRIGFPIALSSISFAENPVTGP